MKHTSEQGIKYEGYQPHPSKKEPAAENKGGETPATKVRASTPPPAQPPTVVEARVDVGFGNSLFIRGQGAGLNWEKGQPLACTNATTWIWSTTQAKDKVVVKLLLNDQVWAKGEDTVLEAGKKVQITPAF